jgi:hypothetical protein
LKRQRGVHVIKRALEVLHASCKEVEGVEDLGFRYWMPAAKWLKELEFKIEGFRFT